jgi:hypothetical protein
MDGIRGDYQRERTSCYARPTCSRTRVYRRTTARTMTPAQSARPTDELLSHAPNEVRIVDELRLVDQDAVGPRQRDRDRPPPARPRPCPRLGAPQWRAARVGVRPRPRAAPPCRLAGGGGRRLVSFVADARYSDGAHRSDRSPTGTAAHPDRRAHPGCLPASSSRRRSSSRPTGVTSRAAIAEL